MANRLPASNGHHSSQYGGVIDPITANRLGSIISNVSSSRVDWFKNLYDKRRNLNFDCGYPDDPIISPYLFRDLYDREPVATRVVQLMPKETWQVQPLIYEDESSENITEFEKAWDALSRDLRGEQSWYQDEEGSPTWEYLKRADILSGIGTFGVLLLGLNDGLHLHQPVGGALGDNGDPKVLRNELVLNNMTSRRGGRGMLHLIANERPTMVRGSTFPVKMTEDYLASKLKTAYSTLQYPTKEGDKMQVVCNVRDEDVRRAVKALGLTPEAGVFVGNSDPNIYGSTISPLSSGGTSSYPDNFQVGNPLSTKYKNASSSDGRPLGTDAQYVGIQLAPDIIPTERADGIKLGFLRAFPEHLCQIVQYESNLASPRFGLPVRYLITLNDPREVHSGVGLPLATVYVHWSRLIHFADNLNSSEIFGAPRMRPVLNPILDVRKIRGAGAEGYWQSCFNLLSIETHPQLGADVVLDTQANQNMMENIMNSMQRWAQFSGASLKSVAPTIADPTAQIDIQIQSICIQLSCPKRVFEGSERGELASGQDDDNWNDRKTERIKTYNVPRVTVPFVDRLIAIGVLPEPSGTSKTGSDGSSSDSRDKETVTNLRAHFAEVLYKSGMGYSDREIELTVNQAVPPYRDSITTNQSDGEKSGGYSVLVPPIDSTSAKDKAAVFLQRTQAWAAYVQGGVEAVIPPKDFATKFDTMDEEEAEAMLDEAKKSQEDNMTMPPAGEDGHPATPPPKPLPPVVAGAKPPGGGAGGPPKAGGVGGAPRAKPAGGAPKPPAQKAPATAKSAGQGAIQGRNPQNP